MNYGNKKTALNKIQIVVPVFIIVIAALAAYYFFIPWLSSQPVRQVEKKTTVNVPEGKKVKRTLYFSLDDRLAVEEREVDLKSEDTVSQVKDILRELIKGPVNDLRLNPLLPEDTKVRSVVIDSNGICYLNLSREIQEKFPGGAWTEFLILYSIVNTLSDNFPGIKGVQILVEGHWVETLAGHIDTRYPLERREDLIGQ